MTVAGIPVVVLLILAAGQTALTVSVGLWLASWLVRRRDSLPTSASKAERAAATPAELLARLVVVEQKFAAAETQIELQLAQLRLQASEARTDGLTGLPNRKAFDEELDRRLATLARHDRPLTLVLCDVDHFKSVNDHYGHQAGDAVLRDLASTLLANLRACDFVARFGGEEFALLLPETELAEALAHITRLREIVAARRCRAGAKTLALTVSLGASQALAQESRESLLRRADAALYAAKSAGRNCVRYHDGDICRAARLREDGRALLADEDELLRAVGDEVRGALAALNSPPRG